ncbi:ATP-binding protein [Sulfuracidifex metallicus]|uniref:ATP-binding protein n=1 Tax=Sulfuracidifex metallicus TaxID=47303 RepID=UPI002273554F|nr:ATP-binding protein [Sulfuracidifex metallicus]MCY0850942.1 ATP-binding protein [Sulfuracidifex metallicus]
MTLCKIPKVTVTTWSVKNVVLAGPTYRKYYERGLSLMKEGQVASIVGQPGMGKTTILKKLEESSKEWMKPIFLDMANKDDLSSEFWTKINETEIRKDSLIRLEGRKKELGYTFWRKLFGVKFWDHVERMCGKVDDVDMRLFCMQYPKNYDGMISLIKDLKEINKVGLLIDEVRETHLPVIHRVINAGLGVPVIMAIPTDSFSRISDLALRRRIEESRISLDDGVTEEDVKEIVETYCGELGDLLLPMINLLWKGKELPSISSILQFLRSESEKAERECGESIECMKNYVEKSMALKNPEEETREMEKRVREALSLLSQEFSIKYIHPRGKRVVGSNGKSVLASLFFLTDDGAYIGTVKLSKDGELPDKADVESILTVNTVEHDKKDYKVLGKLVITNANVNGTNFVTMSTIEVLRIVDGDVDILAEKLKERLRESNLIGKTSANEASNET